MQRSTGLMWIGQKWLLSIHDFFFFFLAPSASSALYTQVWHRMGRPIILALKLVISTVPHTCIRAIFRASFSMCNNPAKFATGPQRATRGVTYFKTRRLRHDYVTTLQQPPRNKWVFQVPQICITTTDTTIYTQ